MQYSGDEFLLFLLFYSFLGWCAEVGIMAVKTGHFCNRGVLDLPLCPVYGVAMDILIVLIPTLQGRYALQAIACVIVTSACDQMSGGLSRWLTKKNIHAGQELSLFSGKGRGILYALCIGAAVMVAILLLHPLVFILSQLIPRLLLVILARGLGAAVLLDILVLFFSTRWGGFKAAQEFADDMQERKTALGKRLQKHIWMRLDKAYPELCTETAHGTKEAEAPIFAKGLCLNKLIWVFLICALLGDIIETFYVRFTAGIWMSRSSLIYGTFSIVWGAGAVLLTAVLQRLSTKDDRYIFLGGFFLGGTYEYMCSVFTELVFGTVFWDYSDMPFNIGGRTNLLFCLFWGILGLVWVKLCYPRISRLIEKIPPVLGMVITWVVVILMVCDMAISGLAQLRYVERRTEVQASSVVETFLDQHYPDSLIEFVWPNMKVQ